MRIWILILTNLKGQGKAHYFIGGLGLVVCVSFILVICSKDRLHVISSIKR